MVKNRLPEKSKIKHLIRGMVLFLILGIAFAPPVCALGEPEWSSSNSSTGYSAIIEDPADLLNETEIRKTGANMLGLTEFCNVGFYTYAGEEDTSVLTKAKHWGNLSFPDSTYTVFMIDMRTRKLGIYSSSSIYKIITTDIANNICDNIFQYASDGNYAQCAQECFNLILDAFIQNLEEESKRWNIAIDPTITEEVKALCDKGFAGESTEYIPITYLGSQSRDGTTHAILCQTSITKQNEVPGWVLAYLNENKNGDVRIIRIVDFDIGAFENPG